MGVFLAYASPFGQALIDRRLYLPEAWAGDEARRRRVQVPEAIEFATKPQIARDLIAATLDAGVPCAWVLADALYGSNSRLRRMLEARGQPYVLAVRSNQTLRMLTADGFVQTDPAQMADELPAKAWAPHAAGEGSKGLRLYDWARIALPWVVDGGFERWVLIRRNRRDPHDRAYYLVFAPSGTALAELAGAAGLRWTIEECFQRAKEELGLDHCEARSWHGWHRHMSLCMAALAFLSGLSAQISTIRLRQTERKEFQSPPPRDGPRSRPAERAGNPLPDRAPAAQTGRTPPLRDSLVQLEATASGQGSQRSSKKSDQCATVVLATHGTAPDLVWMGLLLSVKRSWW